MHMFALFFQETYRYNKIISPQKYLFGNNLLSLKFSFTIDFIYLFYR